MKRFYYILPLLLLVLSGSAFAQSFEGTIEMEIKAAQLGATEALPLTISTKGDKSKISFELPQAGEMAVYSDNAAKRVVTVMAAMNMGFEIKTDQVNADAEATITPATPTGKNNTINGYACDEYTCTTKEGLVVNMWLTKDMPANLKGSIFDAIKNSTQGLANTDSYLKLLAEGYIPIQTVVIKDGSEMATITMKKFEAKSIPDATFEIPANISIQQMPAGMMGK